jgi:hypothetical protein
LILEGAEGRVLVVRSWLFFYHIVKWVFASSAHCFGRAKRILIDGFFWALPC